MGVIKFLPSPDLYEIQVTPLSGQAQNKDFEQEMMWVGTAGQNDGLTLDTEI